MAESGTGESKKEKIKLARATPYHKASKAVISSPFPCNRGI